MFSSLQYPAFLSLASMPQTLLMGPPESPLSPDCTSLPSSAFPPAPLRLPLLLRPPLVAGPTWLLSHHPSLGFPASSPTFHPTVLMTLTGTQVPAFTSSPLLSICLLPYIPHLHLCHSSPRPHLSLSHASEVINSNILWSGHNHHPAQDPGLPSSDVRETQDTLLQACLPPPGVSPSPHPSISQH